MSSYWSISYDTSGWIPASSIIDCLYSSKNWFIVRLFFLSSATKACSSSNKLKAGLLSFVLNELSISNCSSSVKSEKLTSTSSSFSSIILTLESTNPFDCKNLSIIEPECVGL